MKANTAENRSLENTTFKNTSLKGTTLEYTSTAKVSFEALGSTVAAYVTSMKENTTAINASTTISASDPDDLTLAVGLVCGVAIFVILLIIVICIIAWNVKKKYTRRRSSSAILRQIEEQNIICHHGGRVAYNMLVERNISSQTENSASDASLAGNSESSEASQPDKQNTVVNSSGGLTAPMGQSFSKNKDSLPDLQEEEFTEAPTTVPNDTSQETDSEQKNKKETLKRLMNAANLQLEAAQAVSESTLTCPLETEEYLEEDQEDPDASTGDHSGYIEAVSLPVQPEATSTNVPCASTLDHYATGKPSPKPRKNVCQPMKSLPIMCNSAKQDLDTLVPSPVGGRDRNIVDNKTRTMPLSFPKNAFNAGDNMDMPPRNASPCNLRNKDRDVEGPDENMSPMIRRSDVPPAPLPRPDLLQKQNCVSLQPSDDDSYMSVLPDPSDTHVRDSLDYDTTYDWLNPWKNKLKTLEHDQKPDAEPSTKSKEDSYVGKLYLDEAPLECIQQSDALYYNCTPKLASDSEDNAESSGKKHDSVYLTLESEVTNLKDDHSPRETIYSERDSCADDYEYYNVKSDWLNSTQSTV